jgi:hypothetical protein
MGSGAWRRTLHAGPSAQASGDGKMSTFWSLPLSLSVAAVLLAGCGESQPLGAPGAMPQSRAIATHAERGKSWMLPKAKSEDLLSMVNFTLDYTDLG